MSDANFRLSPEPGLGLVLELQDSEGESLEVEVGHSVLSKLDQVLRDLELGVQELWSGDADQTMKELERNAAETMDQILCADDRVRERLAWLGRAADAQNRPFGISLEIEDDSLSRIPWELVGGTSPGSSPLSGARIVRRMGHRSWEWARTGTHLEIHCSGPVSINSEYTDPGGLGEGLADLDAVRVIHPGASMSSHEGSPYRVHHCRIMGGWQISMDTHEVPSDVALTVVELLPSGEADQSLSPAQAWSLGNGGPVVCARRAMLGGVGVVAWDSLYRALAGGLRLEDAVEAVRDSLRLLSHGHPQARWWSAMLLVPPTDLNRASVPLSIGSRLPGAPAGSPEGESVLAMARREASQVGFMGLEHLAEALKQVECEEPLVLTARPGLQLFIERHNSLAGSPGEPRPTPRFLALLQDLSEGFGPLDLLIQLCKVSWVSRTLDPFLVDRLLGYAARLDDPSERTETIGEEQICRRLVIEGGPEDGRVIYLRRSGQLIGRWDPAVPEEREGRLYIESSIVDRTVSRRAMIWQGGNCVEVTSEVRIERVGQSPQIVSGRLLIQPADRIWLGTSTCVSVLT